MAEEAVKEQNPQHLQYLLNANTVPSTAVQS